VAALQAAKAALEVGVVDSPGEVLEVPVGRAQRVERAGEGLAEPVEESFLRVLRVHGPSPCVDGDVYRNGRANADYLRQIKWLAEISGSTRRPGVLAKANTNIPHSGVSA